MKTKLLVFVLTLGLFVSAFGQISTMKLTFIAENNGQYVPLDSIQIENITQAVDTTLYALDTVLVLDYLSSINNHEAFQGNIISVSQNYPNPFNPETTISFAMKEAGNINVSVYNAKGQRVATLFNGYNDVLDTNIDFVWKGKDDNGNAVGSGVYYYKLTAKNRTEIKKMILLK